MSANSSFDPSTMKLIVKTPRQEFGDQVIDGVDLNWNILDLKRHLSRVYPSCPAEKEQRLIYSGKLLPDHLPVRDAFRQGDHLPIIHLVCAFRPQPLAEQGARPKVRADKLSTSSAPVARPNVETTPLPASSSSSTAPHMPSFDGLRQRGPPSPSWNPSTSSGAAAAAAAAAAAGVGGGGMAHPAFPTYSLYSPQQLLWLQHMYARQYYMHYQAAIAAASSAPLAPSVGPSLPVAPHQAAVPAGLPNQAPINNLPANGNAADPAFMNAEGANQNLRMNAQGGPVMEDEEELERDWLDWVYTAARLGVFLSIVYFYSSLSRFLLVMSSLLLMYLHTAGWFPFRRRPVVHGPNDVGPEALQNQQNLENQNQPNAPMAVPPPEVGAEAEVPAEAPEGQAAHPLTPVLVPPHRVSVMWTAWVFFKTFFASLIPEVPQGIAN